VKAAGAQRSLDGFAVQSALFRMRSGVRAPCPRWMGKARSDNGRLGCFETVTSHLAHEPSKSSARCLARSRAAMPPGASAYGAPVSEFLVIRVH
jgi:hypothetical protein